VGGYEDWLRRREAEAAEAGVRSEHADEQAVRASVAASPPKKLSYRERRDLDELPARIEALEGEQRALGNRIADPSFYREPAAAIGEALERIQQIERELADL
jgi:ATP-binding cassette subfamily F protein uup